MCIRDSFYLHADCRPILVAYSTGWVYSIDKLNGVNIHLAYNNNWMHLWFLAHNKLHSLKQQVAICQFYLNERRKTLDWAPRVESERCAVAQCILHKTSGADPGEWGDASPPASHNAPKLAILRYKMEKNYSPLSIPLPPWEGYEEAVDTLHLPHGLRPLGSSWPPATSHYQRFLDPPLHETISRRPICSVRMSPSSQQPEFKSGITSFGGPSEASLPRQEVQLKQLAIVLEWRALPRCFIDHSIV